MQANPKDQKKSHRVNGSRKGSAFERKICKELSLWYSREKHDDWFWRTSGSGARATTRQKKGQNSVSGHGDIGATCPEAQELLHHLCFEIKCGYNDVDLFSLISNRAGTKEHPLIQFYEQALVAAKAIPGVFRDPVVIWKRDRKPTMVILPEVIFSELDLPGMSIWVWEPGSGKRLDIGVVLWEDFLALSPTVFYGRRSTV